MRKLDIGDVVVFNGKHMDNTFRAGRIAIVSGQSRMDGKNLVHVTCASWTSGSKKYAKDITYSIAPRYVEYIGGF